MLPLHGNQARGGRFFSAWETWGMADRERDWMWSEALALLASADRLHRAVFRPAAPSAAPAWEPPVDLVETAQEVLIVAALPGVDPSTVQAVIEEGALVIAGRRDPPPRVRRGLVHRMELPQGWFRRRVGLPPGRYERIEWEAEHGCFTVSLRKAGRP